jgi:hypothetical protein
MQRRYRPGIDSVRDEDEHDARLKRIDLNLPEIVPHSLNEWNARFDDIENEEEGNRSRDLFALTGLYTEGGQRYRAGLDLER